MSSLDCDKVWHALDGSGRTATIVEVKAWPGCHDPYHKDVWFLDHENWLKVLDVEAFCRRYEYIQT